MPRLNADGTPWTIFDDPKFTQSLDEHDRIVRDRWNRHRVTMVRKDGRLHRICSCGNTESVPEGVYDAALNRMCPVEADEARNGK